MRRALDLARTPGVPLGPNPRVGCVLLDPERREVAEGYHRGAGTPHAEAAALAEAGADARGATAVVTLEPCNHTGRTGPCSRGPGRGRRGPRRLRPARPEPGRRAAARPRCVQAGVEVAFGLHGARGPRGQPGLDVRDGAPPALRDLEVRRHAGRPQRRRRRHQPLGHLRGRPASTPTGCAAQCDVMLVGTGTVEADDPELTVRDEYDEPLRPPAAARRDGPARAGRRPPGASTTAAETVRLRDPRPAARRSTGCTRATGSTCSSRAGRRWPAAFVRAGLRRRGGRLRRARAARRRAPAPSATSGITTIDDALRLRDRRRDDGRHRAEPTCA